MSRDRKSTRLNSSHGSISYAVFCLKKKKTHKARSQPRHRTTSPARPVRARRPTSRQCATPSSSRPLVVFPFSGFFFFFFFNDTATTEIYPLSLHDALPI